MVSPLLREDAVITQRDVFYLSLRPYVLPLHGVSGP